MSSRKKTPKSESTKAESSGSVAPAPKRGVKRSGTAEDPAVEALKNRVKELAEQNQILCDANANLREDYKEADTSRLNLKGRLQLLTEENAKLRSMLSPDFVVLNDVGEHVMIRARIIQKFSLFEAAAQIKDTQKQNIACNMISEATKNGDTEKLKKLQARVIQVLREQEGT